MTITLDSRFRGNDGSGMDSRWSLPSNVFIGDGNDKIAGFIQFCKDLIISRSSLGRLRAFSGFKHFLKDPLWCTVKDMPGVRGDHLELRT
jgi:hypothetical protein